MKRSFFAIIEKPGAGTFFTWIAISAAVFFGAYSVKLTRKYERGVQELGEVQSRERELSYRLERTSADIRNSAETLKWANVEIERLRKLNEDFETRTLNLRKLLYTALEKKQEKKAQEIALGDTENGANSPDIRIPLENETSDIGASITLEDSLLFPEITGKTESKAQDLQSLLEKSTDLSSGSQKIVAEVLTYNPSSKKVFISLGSSNGKLREGNRLAIWRNGKHVTDVRVAQVHAVTSTCEVISPVAGSVLCGDVAELINVSAY